MKLPRKKALQLEVDILQLQVQIQICDLSQNVSRNVCCLLPPLYLNSVAVGSEFNFCRDEDFVCGEPEHVKLK